MKILESILRMARLPFFLLIAVTFFSGCGQTLAEKDDEMWDMFRVKYPKNEAEVQLSRPIVVKKLCFLRAEMKRIGKLQDDTRWQRNKMRPSNPDEIAKFQKLNQLYWQCEWDYEAAKKKYEQAKDIAEPFRVRSEVDALEFQYGNS